MANGIPCSIWSCRLAGLGPHCMGKMIVRSSFSAMKFPVLMGRHLYVESDPRSCYTCYMKWTMWCALLPVCFHMSLMLPNKLLSSEFTTQMQQCINFHSVNCDPVKSHFCTCIDSRAAITNGIREQNMFIRFVLWAQAALLKWVSWPVIVLFRTHNTQRPLNSSPLDKMSAISQIIYSDAMQSLVFWIKFHLSLFQRVHLTIPQL